MVTNDTITTIVTIIVAAVGASLSLTAQQQSTLIAGIVTIIAAAIAYWQQQQKATIIQAYTPGTAASQNPAVVATLPARSWMMTDSTKQWCTFDATPANKEIILAQIADAEAQHLTHYTIHYNGGFYIIDYGLLMGGGGNPSGKSSDVPMAASPTPPKT